MASGSGPRKRLAITFGSKTRSARLGSKDAVDTAADLQSVKTMHTLLFCLSAQDI